MAALPMTTPGTMTRYRHAGKRRNACRGPMEGRCSARVRVQAWGGCRPPGPRSAARRLPGCAGQGRPARAPAGSSAGRTQREDLQGVRWRRKPGPDSRRRPAHTARPTESTASTPVGARYKLSETDTQRTYNQAGNRETTWTSSTGAVSGPRLTSGARPHNTAIGGQDSDPRQGAPRSH